MSNYLLFICLLLFSDPVRGQETARIDADRLHVDHAEKKARFEGNVHAALKGVKVTCHTLELTYDDAGNIRQLVAKGGVTVLHKGTHAVASHAELDAKTESLVLTGRVVITREGHRLSGRRVEIRLRTGSVDITEAQGTFVLKSKGRP